MDNSKHRDKVQFFKYYLLFFLIVGFYYINSNITPKQMDTYILTQYLTSYELGFISRGFIGSILSLFFDKMSLWHFHFIISVSNIIMILVSSYFVTKVFITSSEKLKPIVFGIALFFCINPGSISFLFNFKNFGRLEIYSIIIMFIAILLIIRSNSKFVYLVPVLCIISILIYHTSILLYLPIVFLLMFYRGIKEKDKKMIVLFIVSFVLCCITFLYMQLMAKPSFSLEETVDILSNKAHFAARNDFLRVEYFMPTNGHLQLMNIRMPMIINRLILTLILYIPVIYCIFYVYIKAFKSSMKKHKIVYLAILVNILTVVPVFIFAVDYGRWLSAIFITQIVLILTLVYLKDELILNALISLQDKLIAKKYFVVAILVIYAILPRFSHYEVWPLANNLNRFIGIIKYYIAVIIN